MPDKIGQTDKIKDGPAAAPAIATADPSEFTKKAKDLQALYDAVVSAAVFGGGLWLSYLFLFFYLAIAVGGVSHADLFLKNPVKLPVFDVDLPLRGFFILGPPVFLIAHTYTLLHFTFLAGKIGAFNTELQQQVRDDDTRVQLRRQLPSDIFVQFMARPQTGNWMTGLLLWLITWISLIIGPVLLLVLFQLQFLPYHSEGISWWQRLIVVADLVFLWCLWPSMTRRSGTLFARGHVFCDTRWICLRALETLASLLCFLLVFTVATFPGEYLHRASSWPLIREVHTWLVGGDVDYVMQRPVSLWSDRLVLGTGKIAILPATDALRGRNFEDAVLIRLPLEKADFTGAQLKGAVLYRTDLQGAKLGCAGPPSERRCADLQGASLRSAELQGADLSHAQLQGADLSGAQLQGADLSSAHLQGVNLFGTQLEGANLSYSKLKGANLRETQLQGADLSSAQLQGASLDHVFVWRANARDVGAEDARVTNPETARKYQGLDCPTYQTCSWSANTLATLERLIETVVPQGSQREEALDRISQLDLSKKSKWQPKIWSQLEQLSPPKNYDKILASELQVIGCSFKGAPYVIHTLIKSSFNERFTSNPEQAAVVAEHFLDEADCPGARGLSEEDKAALQKIRAAPDR